MARSSMLVASNALGIGAASFASGAGFGEREREMGLGNGKWDWGTGMGLGKRDGNMASKDIAESSTAKPERPKQFIMHNS